MPGLHAAPSEPPAHKEEAGIAKGKRPFGSRRRVRRALLGFAAAVLACTSAPGTRAGDVVLQDLLARAGKHVEAFWSQLEEVVCSEQVSQSKIGQKGKVLYHQESVFDYLIMPQKDAENLSLIESRQMQKQNGNAKNLPLLITNGFSTLELIFHPYYQGSFEYSLLPAEPLNGKNMVRARFRHVRGTRSPSVLRLRGRDYPLDMEGTAWIDPDSGAIARIEAGLVAPMDDVGLRILHCDVRYSPIRFRSADEAYWLPVSAEIEAETPKQHWRNIHQFTKYKRFSVTTKVDMEHQP